MQKITMADLLIKRISFPTYHVNIAQLSLEKHIEDWTKSYRWGMNPEFQRGHVWTHKQRIRYIEYILEGG